ncbi:unnamed protein product [Symbiodinium natans]|uniref:Uncharacterized protein n=1 Tax=Symbiodinium natans TaxID=878477 RepID=A0A812UG63_9DINO|nr:unnamed protein product [Symbiodinium natans]
MSLILSALCGTVNTCPQCDADVLHVFSQDEVQYVGVSKDETVKVDVTDAACFDFELERASLLRSLRERLSLEGLELEDMPDTSSQDFLRLLQELGFESALARAKVQKAFREEMMCRRICKGQSSMDMRRGSTAVSTNPSCLGEATESAEVEVDTASDASSDFVPHPEAAISDESDFVPHPGAYISDLSG